MAVVEVLQKLVGFTYFCHLSQGLRVIQFQKLAVTQVHQGTYDIPNRVIILSSTVTSQRNFSN